MLILQIRFYILLILFSFFSFSFFISFFFFSFFSSFFYFFFIHVKDGRTPLFIAAYNGYEQIVQILLEKGNPNVDLANQVFFFLLILFSFFSFSFFFFFFFFFFSFFIFLIIFLFFFYSCKGWKNSSFYCCSKWI